MNSLHLPEPAPAPRMEFTVLMALLMSIVAISIDAMLPALGIIATDLELANRNHAQYIIVFLFAGMALGQLVAGPLSDALGRKRVLYGGIALYLVGSVVCYLAPTLEVILTGRMIQGIGVAGPYISTVSIVRDKYSGRDMAKTMSLIMMIFIMVPAIAPALGQGILYIADWRAIFGLYIVYSLGIATWIFFRLEETLPAPKRIPFHVPNIIAGFREVLTNRITVLYMLCMGICFGAFTGFLNSSQQIFQDQFGVGDRFPLYFALLASAIGASSLLNSRLVASKGMHYLCVRAFIAVITASAIMLAAHLFVDITLWMFLLYGGIFFFCFGLLFGNINAMAMEPMGHVAGIASAVIGFTSSVISIILGSTIGQLFNGTIIPIASGFLILGSVCLGILFIAAKGRNL